MRKDLVPRLSPDEKRELLERLLARKRAEEGTSPLSFAQQYLYFLDRLDGGAAGLNHSEALRIGRSVEARVLERSLVDLSRRHQALRTHLVIRDGEPRKRVASECPSVLRVVDLSETEAARREALARRLALATQNRAFDLADEAPAWRVLLVRLGEASHALLITVHRIFSDARSMEILVRELTALLCAFHTGEASPLAPLSSPEADFALGQRESRERGELEDRLAHWRRRLTPVPRRLRLPVDRPWPDVRSCQPARSARRLGPQLERTFRARARQEGVAPLLMVIATFQILLFHYDGREDLLVGLPVDGRRRTGLEGHMGHFVNFLPLRARLGGNPSFREVLHRARETTLDALAHQELPFELMAREFGAWRDLSCSPLVQATCNLVQAQAEPVAAMPAATLGLEEQVPCRAEADSALFELSCLAIDDSEGLTIVFTYSAELFEATTIRKLLAAYETLLAEAARRPDARLDELRRRMGLEQPWRSDGTAAGGVDRRPEIRVGRIGGDEIEAAIRCLPGVSDAVTTVWEPEEGARRVVSYVVPAPGYSTADVGAGLHRLPNGLDIVPLNRHEAEFIYREIFEEEVYLQHGVELEDGACVFDVGANIGLFTLFVNDRCDGARVYAFEPIPAVFDRLEANADLYNLDVKLFQCGLGDRAGEADFTYYPEWSGMSGRYADPQEDEAISRAFLEGQSGPLVEYVDELMEGRFDGQQVRCALRTLSQVIREEGIERIDLLKIDVEKSELDLLRGLRHEDWHKLRQIVVEVHDHGGRLERISRLLARHGFAVEVEKDGLLGATSLCTVYARRRCAPRPRRPAGSRSSSLLACRRDLLATETMRRALERELPRWLVPSRILFLRTLPRTPDGEVDRERLPAPEAGGAEERLHVEPGNRVEQVLAGIWEEVLGVERVSVCDDFFDLGGDFMLALRVASQAERLGLGIHPRQVFLHPTVRALAQVAGRCSEGESMPPRDRGAAPGLRLPAEDRGEVSV